MTLTEVVYKIKNGDFALCDFTERHREVSAIVNTTSWDNNTQQWRTIVTLTGPEDKVAELGKLLTSLHDQVEALGQERDVAHFRVATSLETLSKTGNPMSFALEYFGERAIFTPALVKDGYVNTRLIATEKVDLASMLTDYEKGVKAGRWNDFKLIRIDDFNPGQQIQGSFTENLTQKQLEVIKTALALGFYNTPRDVTLDDLSNIFGISKAAVHNRLQAAERKVISKFFS